MADRLRLTSSSSRFPGLLITNLVFTDKKLGRGADATVYEVEWNGTPCAAKRLHEILLEDESPGGASKLVSNFEAECTTWAKLRHPGVVQFLGVYLERSSLLPVLIMEKMDVSLRRYCENHKKKEFPLHCKAYVLRQISQALAYLHGQNPPLVHHDLSPNNVLLNEVSFVTKLTDFGMSRAINPSAIIRKSSIKGTPAFISPEALQNPPRYNEKLDVFSFGNIILSALTHEWPEPDPPTKCDGDRIVCLAEFQRRERYVVMFTEQEKQLFLSTVHQCLENRPDKRPSSVMLMRELRRVESSLSIDGHIAAPIEKLRQQLSAKEEECRQKDEALQKALKEKDEALKEEDVRKNRQNYLRFDEDLSPPLVVPRHDPAQDYRRRPEGKTMPTPLPRTRRMEQEIDRLNIAGKELEPFQLRCFICRGLEPTDNPNGVGVCSFHARELHKMRTSLHHLSKHDRGIEVSPFDDLPPPLAVPRHDPAQDYRQRPEGKTTTTPLPRTRLRFHCELKCFMCQMLEPLDNPNGVPVCLTHAREMQKVRTNLHHFPKHDRGKSTEVIPFDQDLPPPLAVSRHDPALDYRQHPEEKTIPTPLPQTRRMEQEIDRLNIAGKGLEPSQLRCFMCQRLELTDNPNFVVVCLAHAREMHKMRTSLHHLPKHDRGPGYEQGGYNDLSPVGKQGGVPGGVARQGAFAGGGGGGGLDDQTCKEPGCHSYPTVCRYCESCYDRKRQSPRGAGGYTPRDPPAQQKLCKTPGCSEFPTNNGYCRDCYYNIQRTTEGGGGQSPRGAGGYTPRDPPAQQKLCKTPGCSEYPTNNGYCRDCYYNIQRTTEGGGELPTDGNCCKEPTCRRRPTPQRLGYCEQCYEARYLVAGQEY